jgi:ubiquinone/menaquinone biosynthesis C-methylase UbiE
MNCKEIVKAGYNTIALDYLGIRPEDSEDIALLQEVVERLLKGAKVLDAGCGSGVPVTKYLSQFCEVTGVDFAEAQIELARRSVPGARFLCQDMTELDFQDNSFHAICSYYAIIHIPREEHLQLLQNFYRILKPNGLVLLCMGSVDIQGDVAEDYYGAPMYWSHYDAETNIKMIKECKFNLIWSKIVTDSTYPESTHLFVLAKKT